MISRPFLLLLSGLIVLAFDSRAEPPRELTVSTALVEVPEKVLNDLESRESPTDPVALGGNAKVVFLTAAKCRLGQATTVESPLFQWTCTPLANRAKTRYSLEIEVRVGSERAESWEIENAQPGQSFLLEKRHGRGNLVVVRILAGSE